MIPVRDGCFGSGLDMAGEIGSFQGRTVCSGGVRFVVIGIGIVTLLVVDFSIGGQVP